MGRTFGLNSARDVLDLLRKQVAKYKADDLGEDLARQCACTAWALCEWTFRDHGGALGYNDYASLRHDLKRSCPELGYMGDICNETKHAVLTRGRPSVDKAERHGGAFSRGFSRGFDIDRLQIITTGGATIWFVDAIDRVLAAWDSFYARHGL